MKFKNDKQRKAAFYYMNRGRTQQAINSDMGKRASDTRPNTPENVKEWKNNPRRIDIEGIDTPFKIIVDTADKAWKEHDAEMARREDAKIISAEEERLKLERERERGTPDSYIDEFGYTPAEVRAGFGEDVDNEWLQHQIELGKREDEKTLSEDERLRLEKEHEEFIERGDYEEILYPWHERAYEEKYKPIPTDWIQHQVDVRKREEAIEKALEPDTQIHTFEVGDLVHDIKGGGLLTITKIDNSNNMVVKDSFGKIQYLKTYDAQMIKRVDKEAQESHKQASDWLHGVTNEINVIQKEHGQLLMKKQLTDRFNRSLEKGEITELQYVKLKADGEILASPDYDKALKIERQIADIKNRDIPKTTPAVSTTKIGYEIKNLQYEAEHLPKEYKPPKEYTEDDVKKHTWGLTENEAISKYVQNEIDRYERNMAGHDRMLAKFEPIEKKWDKLTPKERKDPANQTLRYDYYQFKKAVEDNTNSYPHWKRLSERAKSGDYEKVNRSSLKDRYVKEIKEAIKKGKPVPYDVVSQYPEFAKSQNSRERYEKGVHTSFANVSIAVDDTRKENHGVKIKLQSGKAITDKAADEIVKTLSQFQSAVGDITHIMKKEDLTISHTFGKHPFLSKSAGMYHVWDKTVTMGYPGVAAHEYGHFIDETAKKQAKDAPKYDFELLAKAKSSFNGGVDQAISLSKRKSAEQLSDARELRVHLGSYWKRPEEIFARLVEQYTAYKNRELPVSEQVLTNNSIKEYNRTPAYWSEEAFNGLLPALENEIQRKIQLASGTNNR